MLKTVLAGVFFVAVELAVAAEPVKLDENTYKPDQGVLIIQLNWGRVWKCGKFENAQLQALTFRKSPTDAPAPVSLELETPSKLFVDNNMPSSFNPANTY